MTIYDRYVGFDFKVDKSMTGSRPHTDPVVQQLKDTWDLRTNYVCIKFSGNHSDPLSDVDWYKNYLALNAYLYNEGPIDKPVGYNKNAAYNMVQSGFVPLGYCPSFAPEMTIVINKILEQKKIPYVRTYATSFVLPFYKSSNKNMDIWVSKMDAAEVIGCAPEKVTSVKLFERVVA